MFFLSWFKVGIREKWISGRGGEGNLSFEFWKVEIREWDWVKEVLLGEIEGDFSGGMSLFKNDNWLKLYLWEFWFLRLGKIIVG